jgi:hypothetical protein
LRQLKEQGADFLLTVKANQQTLHRQTRSQFQAKRKIPFVATDCEISHGRAITWTLCAEQAPEHIREAWIGTSWIVAVMATLRTAALNLLRLAGFQSIRAGMQAVMHDITALLVMPRRQPETNPY